MGERMWKAGLAATALLASLPGAHAQALLAPKIIAACGTDIQGSGGPGQLTMDQTGVLCTTAGSGGGGSGGGSSGGSVTAAGTNGILAQAVQGINGGVPQTVTWSAANPVNNAQVNGVAMAIGVGAANAGTQRVAVSSDSSMAITSIPPLATGSNVIGAVTQSAGPWAVTWSGQSVGVTSLPPIPAGSNVIGAVTQSGGPWSVSWSGQSVGLTGALPAGSNVIGAVTQSGGPWSVSVASFPATQNVNNTQVNGVAIATGTGTSNTGTQRVAVSSDSFPATQTVNGNVTAFQGGAPWSANITQFGGTALATGTGVSGLGIPRVTVASDSTVGLNAGTNTIGTVLPYSAPAAKITATDIAIPASTNTTLVAANVNRIGEKIQCDTGGVNVSETGATLVSATLGGTIIIPATTNATWIPPFATQSAITAYTTTTQTCHVTEWSK